jgi:hypothetical protein
MSYVSIRAEETYLVFFFSSGTGFQRSPSTHIVSGASRRVLAEVIHSKAAQ